jgi:hypothetical protein
LFGHGKDTQGICFEKTGDGTAELSGGFAEIRSATVKLRKAS